MKIKSKKATFDWSYKTNMENQKNKRIKHKIGLLISYDNNPEIINLYIEFDELLNNKNKSEKITFINLFEINLNERLLTYEKLNKLNEREMLEIPKKSYYTNRTLNKSKSISTSIGNKVHVNNDIENKKDIILLLSKTYNGCVRYLKKKYGKVNGSYFCNDSFKSINQKIKRSNEGLYIHHIDEDKFSSLSYKGDGSSAYKGGDRPFKYQNLTDLFTVIYWNI